MLDGVIKTNQTDGRLKRDIFFIETELEGSLIIAVLSRSISCMNMFLTFNVYCVPHTFSYDIDTTPHVSFPVFVPVFALTERTSRYIK